jgi:hypothetical protein
MRKAEVTRNTTETKIHLQLTIDGTGQQSIKTGVGFLDHMLELFVRHGRFDLTPITQQKTLPSPLAERFQKVLGSDEASNVMAVCCCRWTKP